MDKKEILELSRKENPLHDEGVENAQDNGRKWGVLGFLSLYAIVVLYDLAVGIASVLPTVFLLGYLSCEALGRYAARKEKAALVTGIICAIGTVATLASYVMNTLP
ncbi:DUF6442 family protein [Bifidobacterium moukalabense]|uniref:Uncharacterized protein n=1 Tax=Bifidobacterium moukalabense DSM 27321 TaxID=1435051 RepID=W4N8C3_9BIFI|nr:DUF6442 family protein [Bifidobacterium moukalabense]ETY70890.1 hypothetical protein BMOU_1752 [Bifidobacterium moukalabense DSM 27321]